MTFKDSFCTSPWFHMRINNSGTYEPCRWMTKDLDSRVHWDQNIRNLHPLTYFQTHMAGLRQEFLQGHAPDMCRDCRFMEQQGKPSGRQRQLLKTGVMPQYFERSLASSPLRPGLDYSQNTQGHTSRTVSDWQIDLGNYCNGACVFCHPESSSTLATEFKQLGMIEQMPPRSWCDDADLLEKFVTDLINSPQLQYLHFLGGETVITPAFKKILQALVDADLASQITIGLTTNLTVWSDSVVALLQKFQNVNLGMSVETLSPINDYVRYPSQQFQTKHVLDRWVALGHQQKWLMQLRITPTCLTVHDLTTIYDYAWQNRISVESCNFIDNPKFFRISVLPPQQRADVVAKITQWLAANPAASMEHIVNTRHPDLVHEQIVQDAQSYLNYLESEADESHRLPDLVTYLKRLETSRGNSILDYLPQYENIFRSAGY